MSESGVEETLSVVKVGTTLFEAEVNRDVSIAEDGIVVTVSEYEVAVVVAVRGGRSCVFSRIGNS